MHVADRPRDYEIREKIDGKELVPRSRKRFPVSLREVSGSPQRHIDGPVERELVIARRRADLLSVDVHVSAGRIGPDLKEPLDASSGTGEEDRSETSVSEGPRAEKRETAGGAATRCAFLPVRPPDRRAGVGYV